MKNFLSKMMGVQPTATTCSCTVERTECAYHNGCTRFHAYLADCTSGFVCRDIQWGPCGCKL